MSGTSDEKNLTRSNDIEQDRKGKTQNTNSRGECGRQLHGTANDKDLGGKLREKKF